MSPYLVTLCDKEVKTVQKILSKWMHTISLKPHPASEGGLIC